MFGVYWNEGRTEVTSMGVQLVVGQLHTQKKVERVEIQEAIKKLKVEKMVQQKKC